MLVDGRRKVSLLCAASAVVALDACAESTTIDPTDPTADVLPDVPLSTKIRDLTLDQYTETCEWSFEYDGGASRPCAYGSPLTENVERCVQGFELYGPGSSGYLGALLECVVEFVRACDTTGVLEVPPICAEASSVPPGTTP